MSKDEHDPHEICEPPAAGGDDETPRERDNGVAASAPVPWLEPGDRGRIASWLATIRMALVAPGQLIRGVAASSRFEVAFGFAVATTVAIYLVSLVPSAALIALWWVLTGGVETNTRFLALGGLMAILAVPAALIGMILYLLLWGLVTHAVLRVTGKTEFGLRRTYQATMYSSGANALAAIPLLGTSLGWIWWLASAVAMVKEGQKVHPARATFAVLTLPIVACGAIAWLAVTLPSSRGPRVSEVLAEARSVSDPDERLAALDDFILAYPTSTLRRTAHLEKGKVYEELGDDDRALEAYFSAAFIGNTREIKGRLEGAYEKKYGSIDGLHERIDETLMSVLLPFKPGEYQAGDTTGRIVVAELFTGSECAPCVASDLAFDGLIARFDRGTVAILQYHLHIPGPDPLTNREVVERAEYYDTHATPTVFVDGIRSGRGGGGVSRASRNFNTHKESIESRLLEPPSVGLSSLLLTREEDLLTFSGEVDLPDGSEVSLENARVRLMLLEETVHYTGRNGIHFHRFVVRKILSPPDGLDLRNALGETTFSASVSLSDLSAGLEQYLDEFQEEYRERRSDFEWIEKLHEVDAGQLVAVAFVQDDESKEILQAAFAR